MIFNVSFIFSCFFNVSKPQIFTKIKETNPYSIFINYNEFKNVLNTFETAKMTKLEDKINKKVIEIFHLRKVAFL